MEHTKQERYKSPEHIEDRTKNIESTLTRISYDEDISTLETLVSLDLKNISSLYGRVSKRFRGIVGGLLFAMSSQQALSQEIDVYKTSSGVHHTQIVDASYDSFLEQKELVKNLVGYDIYSEAKKVGRSVELSVVPKKQEPVTIVFLGQTHETTRETNWRLRDTISRSQKEIAKYLVSTTTPKTEVLVENMYIEGQNFFEEYSLMGADIAKAKSPEEVFAIYKKYPNGRLDTKNKLAGDKLEALGFKEVSPLVYKKGEEEFMLPQTGVFPENIVRQVSNTIETSIASATLPLHAEGYITIQPVEKGVHAGARKHMAEVLTTIEGQVNRLNTLISPYAFNFLETSAKTAAPSEYTVALKYLTKNTFDLFGFHHTVPKFFQLMAEEKFCIENSECIAITKDIVEQQIPTLKKIIYDEREDEAIEILAGRATSTTTQKVFPLIYGSAHDFTRAVTKWNETHQGVTDIRFNLVTIKSDLDK